MASDNELMQVLLDRVSTAQLSRRAFLYLTGAAGLGAAVSPGLVDKAFAAGENQTANRAKLEVAYDYIVIGAGASGAIVAGELSKTGAKVLVVESGGADTAPTISNPSAAVIASPTTRFRNAARIMRPDRSAHHRMKRTNRIVMVPFRSAFSLTVANSSSAIATGPVRRRFAW